MAEQRRKLVILSAPSGSGKTTIMKQLLEAFPQLEFSISATSRQPRNGERHGVDYHFISEDEFLRRVDADEFVEWEEVYAGTRYGTLKSELERIWEKGNTILFDIDVVGGVNMKKLFGDQALSVFIMPPSKEVLRERLLARGTDSLETIQKRLDKAEHEIAYADKFDKVVVNDNLQDAVEAVRRAVAEFIN